MLRGLFALSALLVPAAVRAEGEGGANTIDTTAASNAVTNMKDAITDFMTGDLMDALLAVIGAAVVIWLLFLGWKLIRRGGKQAG